MKYRYIKRLKMNYGGTQYRQGDILELESLGSLPANWFEVISGKVVEKKTRGRRTKKKEVLDNGDNEDTDPDLGG